MAINKIQNLEAGRDVREKLNAVIDAANEVPNKVEKNPYAVPGNVAVWGAGGVLLDAGIQPGGGDQVNVPTWESVRYIPLLRDFVVQHNDKLYTNKVLDNLNNEPPSEGENEYWAETTKSQANSTPLWAAGTYISERAEVYYLDETTNTLVKYVLRAPAPFVSVDFIAELNAGQWQQIGTPRSHTYTIDFYTSATMALDINMLPAGVITGITPHNVTNVWLTYSGGTRVPVNLADPALSIINGDVLTWEIGRTTENEMAAIGITLKTN